MSTFFLVNIFSTSDSSFVAFLFLSSKAFFFRGLYPHWSTVDSSLHSYVFPRPCYLYILQIVIKETFYCFILHFLFPFYRHIYLQPASPAHFHPSNVSFFVFSQIPFFYKDFDGQLSLKKTSLSFLNQPFILGLSTRKRKETER